MALLVVGNFKLQSWNGFWWHDVQNKVEESLSVGPKVARGRKTINMAILSRMLSFRVMIPCSLVYLIDFWKCVLPSREDRLNGNTHNYGVLRKSSIDEIIILKLSYPIWNMRVWTCFIWLRPSHIPVNTTMTLWFQ